MSQRGVIGYMNQVFGGKTVSGLSENELLGRFVATGDETAFTALVIRHGPMVLGVCRRFLRDIDDVEDAFQATFLVLARRAGAIQRRHLLGPWLHGVAHRVAVRARAKGATRNARELALEFAHEAEAPRDSSPPEELVAKELRGILDDELARLPEALRKPIVLCYLEGMTHDEAARELRWPVGTVRSRMARARSLLRNRLARQGHSASGMALVGNLAREVVPRTLLEATVRASLGFTTGKIPASATALALAKGVLGLMMLQKAMIAGVVVLAATVTVAGAFGYQAGGLGTGSSSASEPPKEQDEASNRNAKKAVSFSDAPLSEQVMALERGLQETTDKINTLQDDYKKLQWELDALRPKPANPGMGMGGMAGMMGGRGTGQPGGMMRGMMSGRGGGAANAGQGMMGMMGAMRGVDRRAMMMGGPAGPDEDHLAFVREQSLIYLVSPEARADSIPGLEILANDVRCTHGATLGHIEDEHLFYLMARGLPKNVAQRLVVEAFFEPVLDRIPLESVRERLRAEIANKIG